MLRITKELLKEGVIEINNYTELTPFRKVNIFKENISIEYFENLHLNSSILNPRKP